MKIALCIPCHGDPKAAFVLSLARMIATTLRAIPDLTVETMMARHPLLVQSRTNLFERARNWGADRILWMDADHSFPPDMLVALLLHRVAIVGANYPRRHAERLPTALRRTATGWELVASDAERAAAMPLEPVDRIGFGLLLMDVATVVAALGPALHPLFEIRARPDGGFEGEDWLLCDRLRAAGVAIHVDHAVSRVTGHVHDEALFFS